MQEIIDKLNSRTIPVLLSPPNLTLFNQGETSFLLDRESFLENVSDITNDIYSPWTGFYVDDQGEKVFCKTHTDTRVVKNVDDFYVLDDEGMHILHVFTNTHPVTPQVQRKVAYVVDENKRLCSDICFRYFARVTISCASLVNPLRRRRRTNADNNLIKDALRNRTTAEARKFLAAQNIFVSTVELSSLSRSVPSHVKTRRGRKPATNATSLLDRFASNVNKGELMKSVIVEKEGDKVIITQVVAYKTAIAHYGKCLPYADELQDHKNNTENIQTLPVNEAQKEFGKYLNSTNLSGSLPLFGSSIFIDTTFSLVSGEYVTLAVAITDQFRTASGKNSSFLLGVMIHSKKNLEAHERFSSFLNECLAKECPDRRVPSIITDGESAFKVYRNGLILKDCVPLRCDVHRCENIKPFFKERSSFNSFKERVFGKKLVTSQGTILKGGLLGVLSRREFDRKLQNLLDDTDSIEANNWLINNACSLFETNSLIKKLEGGWPGQQYLSTNIIEGRNSYLKDLIPSPISACLALDEFLKLHESEMRDRKNAIILERSSLVTDFVYPRFKQLLREEKLAILNDFGFKDMAMAKFDEYPAWVSCGDGKIHKELFLSLLSKVSVSSNGENSEQYFVENAEFITKVEIVHERLSCYHPLCKKSRDYSYAMCLHMLAVFELMPELQKASIIEAMEKHRATRTVAQVRFRTQNVIDGTKYNSRKGVQFSRNNHPRTFHALGRLSLDSTFNTLEDENFRSIDSEEDY